MVGLVGDIGTVGHLWMVGLVGDIGTVWNLWMVGLVGDIGTVWAFGLERTGGVGLEWMVGAVW
jgi:hypothetical protein